MFSKTAILLVGWLAVVCKADTNENVKKDVLLLKDYVLVPVQYADSMLADHLEKLQELKKDSFAALKDLLSNQDQYTTQETAQVVANVMEQSAQVIKPAFRDIRTLLFPNTALKQAE